MSSVESSNEEESPHIKLYVTSAKEGKIEFDRQNDTLLIVNFLTNNTYKIVSESNYKIYIGEGNYVTDSQLINTGEHTLTGIKNIFTLPHEDAPENFEPPFKTTITYETTKEANNKLLFPEFAGWIPQEANVFTLDDLKNEATPSSPTPTPTSSKKLSGGAIAGIVIGCVAVVGAVTGVCIWLFVCKGASKVAAAEATP